MRGSTMSGGTRTLIARPFEHAHAHNGTAAQDEALARIVETLAARTIGTAQM